MQDLAPLMFISCSTHIKKTIVPNYVGEVTMTSSRETLRGSQPCVRMPTEDLGGKHGETENVPGKRLYPGHVSSLNYRHQMFERDHAKRLIKYKCLVRGSPTSCKLAIATPHFGLMHSQLELLNCCNHTSNHQPWYFLKWKIPL